MIFLFLVALLATFSLTLSSDDENGNRRFFTRGERHFDASFDMPLSAPRAKPMNAIGFAARGVDNFNFNEENIDPHFLSNSEKRPRPGQWIFDRNYGWTYQPLFIPSNKGIANVHNFNNGRQRFNDRKEAFIPQDNPATATPQLEVTATPQTEVPETETPQPELLLPATPEWQSEIPATTAPHPEPEFLAIPQPTVLATAHALSPVTNQPVVPVTPQATPRPFQRISNLNFIQRIRPFLPGDSHSKPDRLSTQATTTTKRPRSFFEPSSSEIDEFFMED